MQRRSHSRMPWLSRSLIVNSPNLDRIEHIDRPSSSCRLTTMTSEIARSSGTSVGGLTKSTKSIEMRGTPANLNVFALFLPTCMSDQSEFRIWVATTRSHISSVKTAFPENVSLPHDAATARIPNRISRGLSLLVIVNWSQLRDLTPTCPGRAGDCLIPGPLRLCAPGVKKVTGDKSPVLTFSC